MSILRSKHSGWTWEGKRTPFGGDSGGGGSSGPTTQTTNTSNIPDYARPYVETMLGATQQQMFNVDSSGNITGMKPFVPYSQNPSDYVAGFSPLQQQAQANIANMGVNPGLQQGANMASAAGMGLMGSAGDAMKYGGMGANFGTSAANLAPQAQQYGQNAADIGTTGGLGYGAAGMQAGQNAAGYGALGAQQGLSYGQNATDANAVQSYMNPYLQATLNPAMQLQAQQFGQLNAQNQGQATQQGAFGGGRQAIMQGLNQQNQMLAQNQLVGNAYNQAYNTANQNMQAASQLGMQGTAQGIQGQQAAMQGAGVGLAGVNAAMQGQQTGLQGLQQAGNLYGQGMQGAQIGLQGVQGAQAGYTGAGQQGVNVANIGNMAYGQEMGINEAQQRTGAAQQQQQQNIINQAIQTYAQEQQYPQQQLAFMNAQLRGLPLQQTTTAAYQAPPSPVSQFGGLAATGAGAYIASGGGKPVPGAKGGSTKDIVKMASGGIASGVPATKLNSMLGKLDDKQLTKKANPRGNDPQTAEAAQSQLAFRSQMRPAGIGQNYKFNAAGGGIVAFAEGDVVKQTPKDVRSVLMQEYQTPIEEQIAKNKAMLPSTEFATKYGDFLKQAGVTTEADTQSAMGLRLMQAGLGSMAGTSPFAGVNVGTGSQPAVAGYMQDIKDQKTRQADLAKQEFELGKFGYSTEADLLKAYREDKTGTIENLTKIYGTDTAANAAIRSAEIHAGATMAAAGKGQAFDREMADAYYQKMLEGKPESSYTPAELARFKADAFQQVQEGKKAYGGAQIANAITDAEKNDPIMKDLRFQLQTADEKDKAAIIKRIEAEKTRIAEEVKRNAAKPGVGNAPVPVPVPVPVPAPPPGYKPV